MLVTSLIVAYLLVGGLVAVLILGLDDDWVEADAILFVFFWPMILILFPMLLYFKALMYLIEKVRSWRRSGS